MGLGPLVPPSNALPTTSFPAQKAPLSSGPDDARRGKTLEKIWLILIEFNGPFPTPIQKTIEKIENLVLAVHFLSPLELFSITFLPQILSHTRPLFFSLIANPTLLPNEFFSPVLVEKPFDYRSTLYAPRSSPHTRVLSVDPNYASRFP